MKEYFIVECWFGGGAMVLVDGQLWNGYDGKTGTLFSDRKNARNAVRRTMRARRQTLQSDEAYRIQKVVIE